MSAADLSSLAKRLVVGLEGPWPSAREEAWLAEWRPAGVILFSRNVSGSAQLAALCSHLHDLVPGLEIVADHEGGPVSQLAAAAGRPPAAWTLGRLDDPDLTRRVHIETGRRCRALGIDRILGPCCDVLTERRNPVIGNRSFGAASCSVVRHVAAAVSGLQEAGVESCLKHWPGHGGSLVDSHLSVSRIGDGADPAPFLGGLRAGSVSVMVGHLYDGSPGIADSEFSGQGELPRTLDRERLRQDRIALGRGTDRELCFYADDVTMGALRVGMQALGVAAGASGLVGLLEPGELDPDWLLALADAGCDRLLIRGIPWSALPGSEPVPRGAVAGSPRGELSDRTDASRLPEPEIYREVRRRARQAAGMDDFAASDADLFWLDFTTGDRWEATATAGPSRQRALREVLQGDFREIVRMTGGELTGAGEPPHADRLLITSHRPLPTNAADGPDLHRQLAAFAGRRGHCLVMGHPSLAGDVGSGLGAGWTISALYDTTVADYRGGADET